MILGYSELLKRITGVEQESLEEPMKIISKFYISQQRIAALKELARSSPTTIGKILKTLDVPTGGGSYITIQQFFTDLQKSKILKSEHIGNRIEWSFTQRYAHVQRYFSQ